MYRITSDLWDIRFPNKCSDDSVSKVTSMEDEERSQMTYLASSMCATVLEDTIIQLQILGECNNELRLKKTMIDINQLLAAKYGVEKPVITDELEGIDVRKLDCNEYKLNKLETDRKLLSGVLKDTYKDICLSRVYDSLQNYVQKTLNLHEYRNYLMEEEMKNKQIRRDLYRQLRQQRNHNKSIAYEYDSSIDSLKKQVEDAGLMAATESRYVSNWQRARSEQHLQTIEDKEAPSINSIEYYKQSSDHEQRVHAEMELLVNISLHETLEKIENWMEKYDKDIEEIDLKIQIKKNELQNTQERRENLEKTIAEHEIKMKEWIHFKDEREKARLYREKMNNAAIIVQSWWRGLLVRMELGPYKVLKRKPPAAAGKKKK